jgi:hypothetical protein
MCGMMSACLNPVMYGFLNENFRKEFKDLVDKIACLKSSVERVRIATSFSKKETWHARSSADMNNPTQPPPTPEGIEIPDNVNPFLLDDDDDALISQHNHIGIYNLSSLDSLRISV